eukprot:TRINITY_DN2555_c0_g1_i1.p1 TRINITY_DN2555_c0_g1~~TRINITY_DN2555_c0_g1_i1.p1  ORF type:complete len:336 (-),score=74.55 TRINITY_DN2555_c0_g1_i1:548-1555(-)
MSEKENGERLPKDKKASSKSNGKAKFAIKTDKPAYHEGDTVTGTIFLKVSKPLVCKGVIAKFTGVTKTEFDTIFSKTNDDGETEESIFTNEGKKEFFKEKVKVSKDVTTIKPGSYEYKFSYTLPADLAGSFYDKRKFKSRLGDLKFKGETVYKVKACLDVDDAKDLKSRQEFIVHQKLDDTVTEIKGESEGTVCMYFCIPRGKVKMKSYFDKNAYCIGETAQVHTKIDNESKVDIVDMVTKVVRLITLKSRTGNRRTITETVCEKKFEGVSADSEEKRQMPIKFDKSCYPTSKSSLVDCRYRFEIEAQVPYSRDVEIHEEVTVFEPEPKSWGTSM